MSAAQSMWRDAQASAQSIPRHVPFSFLSLTWHCRDVLFPGNRPSLLPLLLQDRLSLPALWPLLLLGFTVAACFPSPVEVSALPRCRMWKEFWHECVTLHALWHIQMARNGWRGAKQKKKKAFPKKEGWTCKGVKFVSDLQKVNTDAVRFHIDWSINIETTQFYIVSFLSDQ